MDSPAPRSTTTEQIGCAVFALSLFFCSTEMVPGWGIFRLGWPPEFYYGIMVMAGGLAGGLIPKNPSAGIPSGALAGVGALLAQAIVLEKVALILNWILALVGILGTLPGIGLYYGLNFLCLPGPTGQNELQSLPVEPGTPVPGPSGQNETNVDPTACPRCGGHMFRKKQSAAFLALLADRVCLDCGTRYAPPNPRWAGYIYLLCGLLAFGCAAGILWLNYINTPRGQLHLGRIFFGAVVVTVVGLVCVGFGIRCFFSKARSKIIDPGQDSRTRE